MKKSTFRTFVNKIGDWCRKLWSLTERDGNPMTDEMPPYQNCLNCGTELKGMFCHKCGQDASSVNPNRRALVKEYFFNLLPWDRLVLPAFGNLIFHPGRMPKEYCAGRYVSHMHPLKLNLLILVVLLMLFSFVGTEAKVEKQLEKMAEEEVLISRVALSAITESEDYFEKIKSSPRDTVTLAVSKVVVEEHQGVVEIVEELCLTGEECPDTLLAVVPTLLIDDQLLVKKDDVYTFSCENDVVKVESISVTDAVTAMLMVFSNVVSHLPLLMLLTAPFLVLALSIILRRRKCPRGDLYVFSYYYMAFVELLLTVVYILGVIFEFSFSSVSWLLRISLFIYLAIAMKRCYDISTWGKSAIAALFVNVIYVVSCFTFITIFCLVVFVIALLPMVM